MINHDTQEAQSSQATKELTIEFSLNDKIIVVVAFLCIFQVFSKILVSLSRKK